MKQFAITAPDGTERIIEAETQEDAIQQFNGRKQFAITAPDGTEQRFYGDSQDDAIRQFSANQGPHYAPAGVRQRVGNAVTQQDKLATLQSMYPGAVATEDNFEYTDNEGRRVTYNEPGFQFVDLLEFGRVPAEILGGTIAAAPTVLAAGPTGLASLLTTATAYSIGAESVGQAYDAYIGAKDSRGLRDKLLGAFGGVAANMSGAPTNKAATAVAGRGLLGQKQIENVGKSVADQALEESAASYKRIGAPVSLHTATGSRRARALENYVQSTPSGGALIDEQRDEVIEALAGAHGKATSKALGSPEEMGTLILERVRHYAATAKGAERRLWNAVEESFAAHGNSRLSPVTVGHLAKLANKVVAEKQALGRFDDLATNKPLDELIDFISKTVDTEDIAGELPKYQALKNYRSRTGKDIANQFLVKAGDEQQGLRSVYKAATKDLNKAAKLLGGKEGKKARITASDFTRDMTRQLERLEKVLGIPKNQAERAIDIRAKDVYAKAQAAFFASPKRLEEIFNVLGKGDKRRFLDQMLQDMGRAKPGAQDLTGEVFSPRTFVTNWAKLKANAKENIKLFSDKQLERIEDILRVSSSLNKSRIGENFPSSGRVLQGPLTTAIGAGLGTTVGAAVGSPAAGALIGTVAGHGVPYSMGRALTSPAVIKAYQGANRAGLFNVDDIVGAAGRKLAGASMGPGILDQR